MWDYAKLALGWVLVLGPLVCSIYAWMKMRQRGMKRLAATSLATALVAGAALVLMFLLVVGDFGENWLNYVYGFLLAANFGFALVVICSWKRFKKLQLNPIVTTCWGLLLLLTFIAAERIARKAIQAHRPEKNSMR